MTNGRARRNEPGSADGGLRSARALADLLDVSLPVPGTRWRIGLDPIIGLIPGVGDAVGGVLSLYIVLVGARMRVGGATIARMLGNVAIEMLVGVVPLLGDLFDAHWRANRRNVRILEAHLADPEGTRRSSRWWMVAAAAGAVLVVVALVALVLWLAAVVLSALGLG